jgi:DNA repair exonuclease SbcCD nuclease subunit
MYFGDDVIILNSLDNFVDHKNVMIWGIPFEHIRGETFLKKLRSLSANLGTDKINILIFHGELLDNFFSFSREDLGEEGDEGYMPVKAIYFKDLKIDYVLAGHFHSRFYVKELQNGGYFVYPGSPISITKREIGRRSINLFEVGDSPKEYPLDTPYYEKVDLELDPIEDKNPLKTVKDRLSNIPPDARVILTVRGFVNGRAIGMRERDLVGQIKKIASEKSIEPHFEFRDIQVILEDDLFKRFMEKLEGTSYEPEKKKQMRDTTIKAFMEMQS